MEIKKVTTQGAPTPAGHYSQAVVHNGIVYVSGQLPINPHRIEKRVGSIEEQTEPVLRNLDEILRAADSGLDRCLKMTIYISDISLWASVNTVYERVMGEHRPARVIVPTKELHYGFHIEIEAIAAVRG